MPDDTRYTAATHAPRVPRPHAQSVTPQSGIPDTSRQPRSYTTPLPLELVLRVSTGRTGVTGSPVCTCLSPVPMQSPSGPWGQTTTRAAPGATPPYSHEEQLYGRGRSASHKNYVQQPAQVPGPPPPAP
ncbi:hypothetical protein FRC12_005845 [Ceratobasidium sp. 428]|nr:hypothetical protein FRC12_005845 [Ceratobasidium sp. 428]